MAETTRDKVVLASVMEHQLIKLLKEIEEDSKMDTHIQKIFDIQITLMKRWAETPTHAATSIPKKPKRHKFKVSHLSEDDTRDFITCKLGAKEENGQSAARESGRRIREYLCHAHSQRSQCSDAFRCAALRQED